MNPDSKPPTGRGAPTLTWWCPTCPSAASPWTSPSASWPRSRPPPPPSPRCADGPATKRPAGGQIPELDGGQQPHQRGEAGGVTRRDHHHHVTVHSAGLRCAGTVRPRQVQCPLGRLAIAQVSASQHRQVFQRSNTGTHTHKDRWTAGGWGRATVSFAWVCTAAPKHSG